ncbi:glycosyltransferase family 4 protein [Vibrio cyclitrophicus]|nr:Glycosyltransferase [Vibrio cyclitrophicus]
MSIKILHVTLNSGPSNMGYNEFYRYALANNQDVSVSFFEQRKTNIYKKVFFFAKDFIPKAKDADLVHFHSHYVMFIALFFGMFFRLKSIKNSVYTVHTSYSNLSLRNKIIFFINCFFSRKVVFCSKSSFSSFPSRLTSQAKYSYIRNGVNLNFYLRRNLQTFDTRNGFCCLGRLIPLKAPIEIAQAFVDNGFDYSLTFIGAGALKVELEKIAIRSNNIHFTGLIPRNDVIKSLLSTKFYISNSTVEGMPIAALEAIACGCYPVLSKIEPHCEILSEGIYGVLIEDGIFNAVSSAVSLDDSELNYRINVNKNILKEKFSLESMHSKYQAIYNKIIFS